MDRKNAPTSAERTQTDESLDLERKKTDKEIGKRTRAIDVRSDAVIEKARDRADEVLGGARDQADQVMAREGGTSGQRQALKDERDEQDAAVRHERLDADVELEAERIERERALAALLRFEREQTDERLLTERTRGDAVMAAKDDFMSMINHDVRTLLGCIAMATGLQIRSAPDDEFGRQSVRNAEKIQRFTARITRLVGDMVDVASIESGRLSVTPEENDVRKLLEESSDAFQPVAADRKLKLLLTLPPEPVLATFDHDRLLQVMANLLSNSLKFTPEGGEVSLTLETAPDELRICVADTGQGIDAGQLETVFERFWQVTKHDARGLGLGLFIARCIVEAHGGRIWAESVPAKGSTFTFTLPIGAARATQEKPSE